MRAIIGCVILLKAVLEDASYNRAFTLTLSFWILLHMYFLADVGLDIFFDFTHFPPCGLARAWTLLEPVTRLA